VRVVSNPSLRERRTEEPDDPHLAHWIGYEPGKGDFLELFARGMSREKNTQRRIPRSRAIQCWLLDRGMSWEDIRAIPNTVKRDYEMMWMAGLVGPTADRRGDYMNVVYTLACSMAKSSKSPDMRDVFPELRWIET